MNRKTLSAFLIMCIALGGCSTQTAASQKESSAAPSSPAPAYVNEADVMGTVTVTAEAVRKRVSPKISAESSGKATAGEIYNVYAITHADGYTWYKTDEGLWLADNGSWLIYRSGAMYIPDEAAAEETAAAEQEDLYAGMYEISWDGLPSALDSFLTYYGRTGDDTYDSTDPKTILENIIGSLSCVDLDRYPEASAEEHWMDGSVDPRGVYSPDGNGSYGAYRGVEWILANIFNCTEEGVEGLRESGGDEYYYEDGVYYTEIIAQGYFDCICRLVKAEYNGTYYRVTYDRFSGWDRYVYAGGEINAERCVAVMQLKQIDEEYYWSLYTHEVTGTETYTDYEF